MITLRQPVSADVMMVHAWRNHPDVARFMYRDSQIPLDEHKRWFESVVKDSNSARYRIFEINKQPRGWTSSTRIDAINRSCDWGGYLAPASEAGSGWGRAMLFLSLEESFTQFQMNRVSVEVLVENERAIGLYDSMGFVKEGCLRARAWQSRGPRDVYIYSMLAIEWLERRKDAELRLKMAGLID